MTIIGASASLAVSDIPWDGPLGALRIGRVGGVEIQAREILSLRTRLNNIYVDHTGQPLEVIERAMERDKYMTASEAKDFGLIDEVVTSRPTLADAVAAA